MYVFIGKCVVNLFVKGNLATAVGGWGAFCTFDRLLLLKQKVTENTATDF